MRTKVLKSVGYILTVYFLHSRWLRIYVYSLVVKSPFVAEVGSNDLYRVVYRALASLLTAATQYIETGKQGAGLYPQRSFT